MEFTKKVDLPSGGWVELRNAHYLRAKDRNELLKKLNPDSNDGLSNMERGLFAINQIGAIMIVGWELPYQPDPVDNGDGTTTARGWTLPKDDPTILDELFAPDANTLQDLLGEARKVLMPQAPSPDQSGDPESPSGPVNA